MASSRGTSSGPDLLDVSEVWQAFEEQLAASVKITAVLIQRNGCPALEFTVTAERKDPVPGEASPWAWARKHAAGLSPKTLDAVVLQLLYSLDFAIGEKLLAEEEGSNKLPPAH